MIEIQNLCKSYGGLPVLDNISLTIQDGEIFGLVGQSGAGKSTLLDCISGLETYESGSVTADGTAIESLDKKELRLYRKKSGMIFQNFSLLERKDVFHNISFPMECWGIEKSRIKERVEELAGLTGISDKLKSRPSMLSGGQKQRVAIARALAMRPKYLFCDECTSALDPKTTKSILELLRELRNRLGITIIVVTHEMDVVRQICDRMAIVEDGKLSVVGHVEEIFRDMPVQLRRLIGEDYETEKGKEGKI